MAQLTTMIEANGGNQNGLPVHGRWATKTDVAYQLIRRRILDGVIAPGAVIEQEPLARELGVSTTPLREALRRLESEGLLSQVAHREMRVPDLTSKELIELYVLRIRLESYAVAAGAECASPADHAAVRALLSTTTTDLPITDHLDQNRRLHRAMCAASGNNVLVETLDRLWDRSDRYRAILLKDHGVADVVHDEHEEIVEAYCTRQVDAAATLVQQHLEMGRATLLARFENSTPPWDLP